MKSLLVCVLLTSLSLVTQAEELKNSYGGSIQSASQQVSVKYWDGSVRTFDVSDMIAGSVTNESYERFVSISKPVKYLTCSMMIGELASDYKIVIKTDENEIVTFNFKASTREARVLVSGNCDGAISGEFSLYMDEHSPLPIESTMSQEPAGAPRRGAR